MTITTKNALETRDSLRKALFGNQSADITDEGEAALAESKKSQKNPDNSDDAAAAVAADKKQEDSRVEGEGSPNKAPVEGEGAGTDDAGNKQGDEKGKDTASATEGEGKKAKEPEAVAGSEDASKSDGKNWEAEFHKMERQFKAIQSAVTPTQQKNARLEKEVADLRAKLEAQAVKPKVDEKNLPEVFEKIREVFPEGADLMEDLYARTKQVDQVQADLAQRDERAAAGRRDAVIGQIINVHPDAQQLIKDEKFWKWVQEAHDPGAVDFMTNVVTEPWNQDPQLTIDIFNSYKEETAPRRTPPPPAAKPAAQKTPTDIAPTGRDLRDESRVAPNGNQGKVWSDKDWSDARRKLNANGLDWKAKDELRKEMRRQLSLKQS